MRSSCCAKASIPVRSYFPEPSSINVQCDQNTLYCRVQGLVNFDSKSPSRNQRSRGAATLDYLLAFRPDAKLPTITMENGKVANRRVEPLVQATNESSPFDFNARQ